MRLVCPNCDAEYEVEAGVIPLAGREVQCSNCGNAWFQLPPDLEAEFAAEDALYDPLPDRAAPTQDSAPAPVAMDAPAVQSQPDISSPVAAAPVMAAPNRQGVPARSIDESVLQILREEAARESTARSAEVKAPAAQPRPDPTGAANATQTAPAPQNRKVYEDLSASRKEADFGRGQNKSELLPEIEEINSTLRASSERRASEQDMTDPGPETEDVLKPKSASFRAGFVLMLLLAAVLVATYVLAPRLSDQIPSMSATLKEYVAVVDGLRVTVDGLMKSAIGVLQGLIGDQA
jgi:predicted Zn finger-like uncharacterized protein